MLFKCKLFKAESGQAMIIFALVFVALCGATGYAVDIGRIAVEKGELQNAADAAALAGAQDLPAVDIAKSTAMEYAALNGIQASEASATTSLDGGSTRLEVVFTRTVPYTFARVFGLAEIQLSVRAVAENNWQGEALPFINLDDKYTTEGAILTGWNKVGPGDKERIHNDDLTVTADSIIVHYEDGVEFKKGKDNSIGGTLNNILGVGKTVYLFSLSNDVIDSGVYQKKQPKELKNKDVIPLSDMVLLKCKVTAWEGKEVTLVFEGFYDISKNEFPTAAKLVG